MIVAVGGEDGVVVEGDGAEVAALGVDPVGVTAVVELVEGVHAVNLPGLAVVVADDGVAAASVAGEAAVADVDAPDNGEHEIAIADADEVAVMTARFEYVYKVGPSLSIIS